MLLTGYTKHLAWADCSAKAGCMQCLAHLDEDISQVLPFLNAALSGCQYLTDPVSVMFKIRDKVVVVHPDRITINMVADDAEADQILEWLKGKINEAWERREEIEPRFQAAPRMNVVEILRILGDADCRACGEPSCVAYAVQIAQRRSTPDGCSTIPEESRKELEEYIGQGR